VSAWRRRAIEEFPELHDELAERHEVFSVYGLWFHLLPLVRRAHRENNEDLLRRIYDFADWCRRHADLNNSVCVSFYEHLMDERWMRPLAVPWLTREIVDEVRPLWELMLSPDALREVDALVQASLGTRRGLGASQPKR
jgi:hypothetical protein